MSLEEWTMMCWSCRRHSDILYSRWATPPRICQSSILWILPFLPCWIIMFMSRTWSMRCCQQSVRRQTRSRQPICRWTILRRRLTRLHCTQPIWITVRRRQWHRVRQVSRQSNCWESSLKRRESFRRKHTAQWPIWKNARARSMIFRRRSTVLQSRRPYWHWMQVLRLQEPEKPERDLLLLQKRSVSLHVRPVMPLPTSLLLFWRSRKKLKW